MHLRNTKLNCFIDLYINIMSCFTSENILICPNQTKNDFLTKSIKIKHALIVPFYSRQNVKCCMNSRVKDDSWPFHNNNKKKSITINWIVKEIFKNQYCHVLMQEKDKNTTWHITRRRQASKRVEQCFSCQKSRMLFQKWMLWPVSFYILQRKNRQKGKHYNNNYISRIPMNDQKCI